MIKKIVCIFVLIVVCGCFKNVNYNEYGVFLNLDSSSINKLIDYKMVVVDAQYLTSENISFLKRNGIKVYSYLNIGSIETFRDYYKKYEDLTLKEYKNWDGEYWVDIVNEKWQQFIIGLAKKLNEKGVDGFFIDNCDVYYEYHNDEVFNSITLILKSIANINSNLIINGGDTYVLEYLNKYKNIYSFIKGINQETVFTEIDFENSSFRERKNGFEYYKTYIDTCDNNNIDVYLIEYTTDDKLKNKIYDFCNKKEYKCYVSKSLELK